LKFVTKWLTRLSEYLIAYGAFGLFALALLDSTFVPLPSSADALMLVLSTRNPSWMLLYAFMATSGSALGCWILYLISRRAGARALNRFSDAKQRRVKNWIEAQDGAGEARRADLIENVATEGAGKVLVLDVFLRYAVCAHGKTPAFAAGPFNATDYVVPSRLADAFELTIGSAARDPETKTLVAPANSLPELDTQLSALMAAATAVERDELRRKWKIEGILNAWPVEDSTAQDDAPRLSKLREHRNAADWDKLLLARVSVPVVQDGAGAAASLNFPRLDATRKLTVDNFVRPVVFNPMRWAGT